MPARALVLVVLTAAAGCQRGAASTARPAPDPVGNPPVATDAMLAPPVDDPPIPDHPAGECRVDGDCALLPPLVGCNECPPAPPFDVGTRAELDAMLMEAEEECATEPVQASACPSVSDGCTARAACVETRCAAIAPGC